MTPAALQLPPPAHPSPPVQVAAPTPAELEDEEVNGVERPGEEWAAKRDRLLLAGAGRKRLQDELGISEWEARQLLQARAAAVESDGEETGA